MVQDGQEVGAGETLVKIPRETTKTKDITGGLPRVVELFEARSPKEPAIITEIDGTVRLGDIAQGHAQGHRRERRAARRASTWCRATSTSTCRRASGSAPATPLIDGPINPHDVLQVLGEKELQRYLTDKIQEVYRSQSVAINDKHIEVIVRQMMRSVKIEEVGDTEFLIDEQVDRWRFQEENDRVLAAGGQPGDRPAAAPRHHQGVALDRQLHLGGELPGDHPGAHRGGDQRRVDYLRGLKENVIVGRLIPAGTGMALLPRLPHGRGADRGRRGAGGRDVLRVRRGGHPDHAARRR